jgi:hypothetical protein
VPANRPAAIFRISGLLALAACGALFAQSAPNYLNRQLSPNGEAASEAGSTWAVDPRGEWVAFVGDVEIAGADAVYSMRRNGGQLRRLSAYGALGAFGRVEFSADGRRVIYIADLDVAGRDEIWSVAPWSSAAAAVKLNVAVTGTGVRFYRVPPSGSRIAYIAEIAGELQAWSVLAAGPSASGVRLDPGAVGDEVLLDLIHRPDGAQLLVEFFDPTAWTSRIFTVPIAGPAASAVPLIEPLPGGCAGLPGAFTADSSRLVYGVACTGFVTRQIWSVPANGPAAAAVSLAGSFAAGGEVKDMAISPDGEYVVFVADRLVDERFELFSVPTDGPAAAIVRLNPTLVENGDLKVGIQISPDSTRVAYIADQVSDERFFPYSVPIGGPSSASVVLYQGLLAVGADASRLAFTPDSSRVVFNFDLVVDQRFDLYWAPADGSAPHSRITNRGTNPAPPRSVNDPWRIHPDGQRVIYAFDENAANDLRGIGEQRFSDFYEADARLNGVPVTGGRVSGFVLYPDGMGLAYVSDEVVDDKSAVFTTDLRIFGDGFESGDTGAWGDTP